MASDTPLFENYGDGVYLIRQEILPIEIREHLNVLTVTNSGGLFNMGGECTTFHNRAAVCDEYYALYLANDQLDSLEVLAAYVLQEGFGAALSLTIHINGESGRRKGWIYALTKNRAVIQKRFTEKFIRILLQKLSGDLQLWIGVKDDPEHPESFLKLIRLYLSYGFVKPRYDKVLTVVSSFWACNMVYTGEEYPPSLQDSAVDLMRTIKDSLGCLGRLENSTYTAVFPPKIYTAVNELLYFHHEYGGSMEVDRAIINDDFQQYIISRMGTTGEHCGIDYRKVVDTTGADVHFHTHPSYCYVKEKLVLGPPSAEDFSMIVEILGSGTSIHQIVTREGVYTYALTDPFKALLIGAFYASDLSWVALVQGIKTAIIRTIKPLEYRRSIQHIYGRGWTEGDEQLILSGQAFPVEEPLVRVRNEIITDYTSISYSDIAARVNGDFGVPFLNFAVGLTDFPLFTIKFDDRSVAETSGIMISNITKVRWKTFTFSAGTMVESDTDSEVELDTDSDSDSIVELDTDSD